MGPPYFSCMYQRISTLQYKPFEFDGLSKAKLNNGIMELHFPPREDTLKNATFHCILDRIYGQNYTTLWWTNIAMENGHF